MGAAICFASIIVTGGLYHAGVLAPSLLRTKAFCLASAVLQVVLEGLSMSFSSVLTSLWDFLLLVQQSIQMLSVEIILQKFNEAGELIYIYSVLDEHAG